MKIIISIFLIIMLIMITLIISFGIGYLIGFIPQIIIGHIILIQGVDLKIWLGILVIFISILKN